MTAFRVMTSAFTTVRVTHVKIQLNGMTRTYSLPARIAGSYTLQELCDATVDFCEGKSLQLPGFCQMIRQQKWREGPICPVTVDLALQTFQEEYRPLQEPQEGLLQGWLILYTANHVV